MSVDEESFVVLGSCSPGNSINVISLSPSLNDIGKPQEATGRTVVTAATDSIPKSVDIFNKETLTSKPSTLVSSGISSANGTVLSNEKQETTLKKPNLIENQQNSTNTADENHEKMIQSNDMDSLAASFILGDVSADMLKQSSIYSQFPSLSMQACAEDAVKVQNLMAEYIKMKGILMQVSDRMKEVSDRLQDMKEEMKTKDMESRLKLEEFQMQIATLTNQNLDLKRELQEKVEHMEVHNSVREKEQAELIQAVSEKSSQIANMAVQIEKLEEQQLASFEFVAKSDKESKDKSEYVARLEHERIVKDLERRTSELLAEKLELSDMQKQYIDEITCLKVNLTASEELMKQSNTDIALLKANDIEKSTRFEEYQSERNEMREQLTLLQHQVEVYSKDFQLERTAREEMAGERTQLLDDLHALQRKNQDLYEQVAALEERVSTVAPRTQQPPQSQPKPATVVANSTNRPIRQFRPPSPTDVEEGRHNCPICAKYCISLSSLQEHVNDCLDRTT